MPPQGNAVHESMSARYRAILRDRRIPLLPWSLRRQFVELIWAKFDEHADRGISFDEMSETLLDHAKWSGLPASRPLIRKLLYSLNFAQVFNFVNGAPTGVQIAIPEDLWTPLHPVAGISGDKAIDLVHEQYIKILVKQSRRLDVAAVFELLYGDEIKDDHERETRRGIVQRFCEQYSPPGDICRPWDERLGA